MIASGKKTPLDSPRSPLCLSLTMWRKISGKWFETHEFPGDDLQHDGGFDHDESSPNLYWI